MSYKLYDFNQDPKLDEQIRLICDLLYNKRETYAGQIGGGAQGLASFRQTTGLTWGNRWYAASEIGQTSTTGVFTQDILYAIPFLSGNNIAINGMGYSNDDVTASNIRIGIYNNTAPTDLYPSSLVTASAVIPTGSAAGFKYDNAVIANLESDSLYWAAILCSVTLNLMRVMPLANGYGWLGRPMETSSATRNNHISVAFPYAALPSTFPASATNGSGAVSPLIFLRFSA